MTKTSNQNVLVGKKRKEEKVHCGVYMKKELQTVELLRNKNKLIKKSTNKTGY